MTRQESFKRRIRQRMAATGERYSVARRSLIAPAGDQRQWAADPGHTDEAITDATGSGWEHWCEVLDAHFGASASETPDAASYDHGSAAAHLVDQHGVAGWWAQTVAVGYERITGLRLPHQRMDGTFTATKSRTVPVAADELRSLLLDDGDRAEIFGDRAVELRSRPGARTVRLGLGEGVAVIATDALPDGRTRISVSHEKLTSAEAVEEWKEFWSRWLDAVAAG